MFFIEIKVILKIYYNVPLKNENLENVLPGNQLIMFQF